MLSELFSVVVRTNVLCNCYASDFKKKSQSCLGMQRSRLIFVLGGKQSHILINNKFNFCFKMSRTYCKQCLTDVQMRTFGRTLTKSCDSLKEQNWKALNKKELLSQQSFPCHQPLLPSATCTMQTAVETTQQFEDSCTLLSLVGLSTSLLLICNSIIFKICKLRFSFK